MTATTASACAMQQPLTLESIQRAVRELEKIKPNDKCVFVNPDGQMVIGKIEDILPAILKCHPLFKSFPPLKFGEGI